MRTGEDRPYRRNLARQVRKPTREARAPRLAEPAERPVRLQTVNIDTEVSGAQAVTSVEMIFHNPNRRVHEGELQFPLLDGQQVVGFALDIDGKLREAVPVDKARGQQVFEDIAREGVDPGLLAKTAGNNYKLRVYPLPAQGHRRVVIRYSETLSVRDGERLYRLPLAYAETLDRLNLRLLVRSPQAAPTAAGALGKLALVRVGTDYRADIARQHFAAKGWVELKVAAPTQAEVRTQQIDGRTWFVAEVPVPVPAPARSALRKLPGVVGLLWDSSGSGATRDRSREFALLDAYFKRLGNGEVRLTRLRDSAEASERFAIRGGDWKTLRQALEATPYDGATRLSAFSPDAAVGEYLLFSDGLENFGDGPFPKTGVAVHACVAALRSDAGRLRHIAGNSGGRFVDLLAVPEAEAERSLLGDGVHLDDLSGKGVASLLAASPHPENGRLLVAGVLDAAEGELRLTLRDGGATRVVPVRIRPEEGVDSFAAATWVRLKIAALEGEYRLHRAEIRQLGEQFGLVTRETSLIVLDRADDYARHDIKPPPELRAEVERLRQTRVGREGREQRGHLEQVVRRFEERRAWWAKDFPKGKPPAALAEKLRPPMIDGAIMPPPPGSFPYPAPSPVPMPPQMAEMAVAARMAAETASASAERSNQSARAERNQVASKAAAPAKAAPAEIAIRLQAATPGAAYAMRLRQAAAKDLYRIYLDERRANTNSTAFYLDAADLFFERKQRDLGLRILSNLAEMDLENRHILRILGYRLLQAGAAQSAITALQRVLELAPNEPQSWRDLGLAYAAAGDRQKAVDHLLEVVIRPWHGRFPDIEQTALSELNAIVATSPTQLDTSRLDSRLAINLPLELRVILSWDADNTDIDLWVTDPNGEKAFYENPLSYQGGRVSADFTGGYGPEEFALKRAKPGKYKVEANFFGHRQQLVAGATTLQLKLTTRFGSRDAEEKMVTLRLKGKSEVVFVGEFEVK